MDPTCVFNFFTFFERILYKSNCIIFIFSWCRTHTKIRSKLVVIVTAGSQKITLWGPQRTPLGILRVKYFRTINSESKFNISKTSFIFNTKRKFFGVADRATLRHVGVDTAGIQRPYLYYWPWTRRLLNAFVTCRVYLLQKSFILSA